MIGQLSVQHSDTSTSQTICLAYEMTTCLHRKAWPDSFRTLRPTINMQEDELHAHQLQI